METLKHCPYAIQQRERMAANQPALSPSAPRRDRRALHRYIWNNRSRNQPTFQEAWRAFNNTLKGTLN